MSCNCNGTDQKWSHYQFETLCSSNEREKETNREKRGSDIRMIKKKTGKRKRKGQRKKDNTYSYARKSRSITNWALFQIEADRKIKNK